MKQRYGLRKVKNPLYLKSHNPTNVNLSKYSFYNYVLSEEYMWDKLGPERAFENSSPGNRTEEQG